jgi:DNA-binding NarL/FixJ family response regulator
MTAGRTRRGPFHRVLHRLLGALGDTTPAFASDPPAGHAASPAGFVRRLLIALSDTSPAFQRADAVPGSAPAEARPDKQDVLRPGTPRTGTSASVRPPAKRPEPKPSSPSTPPYTPTSTPVNAGNDPSPRPRSAPRRSPPPREHRPTVLIAEDDLMVSDALRISLGYSGFTVVGTATDGKQAVEQVEFHRPDLVTMDIMMPGMDGWSAARIIGERYPATRVVMVTARAGDRDNLLRALAHGAVGFLTKPFSMDELIATLREAAGGGFPIAPAITAALGHREADAQHPSPEPKFFTDVESGVLRHLAENRSAREIAERTGFTLHEVHEIQVLLAEKIKLRSSLESDRPG